jgi:hypothetical protein
MGVLRAVVFWSYARGTLQYDVLCAFILVLIFVTPRHYFQDWPVINNPHQFASGEQIVNTFDDQGNPVLNISTQLVPANRDASTVRNAALTQLQRTLNKPISIADIKPILGNNGETIGYSIWLGQESSTTF